MQVSSPWFCLGVIQIGTFYGFTGEGATPSPTSRPLQLKAILLPHSPWGRKSCPPWSKQFSQDEPRSPDTSSPGCPHVHQGVWHVISYLDTTRRTVGQEPGSLFWVGVRARFRNGLGEQSVWGFCPCDWEAPCGRCAPCRCPCPCGRDIFSVWPMPMLSLEPPCFGNSRALVTAQARLFL